MVYEIKRKIVKVLINERFEDLEKRELIRKGSIVNVLKIICHILYIMNILIKLNPASTKVRILKHKNKSLYMSYLSFA